ncbi:segregation/condensation protein A [Erysipelothrix inopinata]|uniref:Segregation and condensation protein A n=1 Tax=Erysipelothrix inopinata TaxID=225084 RepID=A0A7G9RXY3_9FIRM|nr:segregation/condensation protein A [Erysipelothrix inopinata]QNN60458.1 segregation/condensation protein A [Erysipelothrix inopinata]
MNFEISLEQFNGPLDLMLHLIKDKKLDLFDLDIVELADQYIAFINNARDSKLEIASEYLSELAGLIEFKSKKLLPRDKSELETEDLEDDENDLVRRLLEYQRYKEVSLELAQRYEERSLQYSKPFSAGLFKQIKRELNETISYDQTPYDLMNAMIKVMERFRIQNPQDVSLQRVELSVDDVIDDLRNKFLNREVYTLTDVLNSSRSMQHLLVNFLAILDMLRMGELLVSYQGEEVYLKGALS